ncbi:hypothetical protein OUZ56_032646 [Daphnia magna]|uniref:Uncharacterized protein n=1 Tax=Daphnia magna TaxID=35525 RepID=A0ABR0B9I1_9CRUS|nr:hypothetical protein OUZ56_032646 [Daphnia magna]
MRERTVACAAFAAAQAAALTRHLGRRRLPRPPRGPARRRRCRPRRRCRALPRSRLCNRGSRGRRKRRSECKGPSGPPCEGRFAAPPSMGGLCSRSSTTRGAAPEGRSAARCLYLRRFPRELGRQEIVTDQHHAARIVDETCFCETRSALLRPRPDGTLVGPLDISASKNTVRRDDRHGAPVRLADAKRGACVRHAEGERELVHRRGIVPPSPVGPQERRSRHQQCGGDVVAGCLLAVALAVPTASDPVPELMAHGPLVGRVGEARVYGDHRAVADTRQRRVAPRQPDVAHAIGAEEFPRDPERRGDLVGLQSCHAPKRFRVPLCQKLDVNHAPMDAPSGYTCRPPGAEQWTR